MSKEPNMLTESAIKYELLFADAMILVIINRNIEISAEINIIDLRERKVLDGGVWLSKFDEKTNTRSVTINRYIRR